MKTFYALEPHLDGTTMYQPGDKREVDEASVTHLVELKVLGDKPPKAAAGTARKPKHDYEKEKLGDIALDKASKDQLLVIAAYEKADAPEGDALTEADLIKAITAKRGKGA
jgi:hypothetical protein